jgi:uncharacterized protein (DUF433 family)
MSDKPEPSQWPFVILMLVLIIVGVVFVGLLAHYNPSLGLVVATYGLIFATLIYAYFTFRLVSVTDLARQEQVQPVIRASLSFIEPFSAVLRCQNIGRGSATDVIIDIEVHPQSLASNMKWKEPVLLPLTFRDFILPGNNLDDLQSKVDYVVIKGKCKDAFGRPIYVNDRIEVKELIKNIKSSNMRFTYSAEDFLNYIADNTKKLADIENRLKDLKDSLAEKAPGGTRSGDGAETRK